MHKPELQTTWAIFCRVVDNHGDLGVCWRLASQLAARGHAVLLYVDDASALAWMAPEGCPGIQLLAWPAEDVTFVPSTLPDVVIEAFGCELPLGFQAAMGLAPTPPVWVNLEYFSAEASALRNHGLPSPVMGGPAKGLTKWFFYPGLSPQGGGVLGPGVDGRSAAGITNTSAPQPQETVSAALQLVQHPPHRSQPLNISLFCYEPASLGLWLQQLASLPHTVHLRVTAGRASQAVLALLQSWTPPANLVIEQLPFLSHPEFDQLLATQDLNLVRGEDSLARAIWVGQAFLWQIYPQDDGAHWPKLKAFLQATQAPPLVVQAHLAWNAEHATPLPACTPQHLAEWHAWAQGLQQRLQAETDLLTRLKSFVAAHG